MIDRTFCFRKDRLADPNVFIGIYTLHWAIGTEIDFDLCYFAINLLCFSFELTW